LRPDITIRDSTGLEIRCSIEVRVTHATDTPRSEPWFEFSAAAIDELLADDEDGLVRSMKVDCLRTDRGCESCLNPPAWINWIGEVPALKKSSDRCVSCEAGGYRAQRVAGGGYRAICERCAASTISDPSAVQRIRSICAARAARAARQAIEDRQREAAERMAADAACKAAIALRQKAEAERSAAAVLAAERAREAETARRKALEDEAALDRARSVAERVEDALRRQAARTALPPPPECCGAPMRLWWGHKCRCFYKCRGCNKQRDLKKLASQ
jgi:hypothetical protein